MNAIVDRMIRASRLEPGLYEEVEADRTAMGQAMAVVVVSSAAAGIGTLGQIGAMGLLIGTAAALAGWYIWAFLTYIIGTRLLPEPQTRADYGELLRTTGFSSAPGVLRIFGFVPLLGNLLFFVAGIWMLVAMVVAVRQALDYTSTWRAVGVCVIGWIVQALAMAVVFALFGGGFEAVPQSG